MRMPTLKLKRTADSITSGHDLKLPEHSDGNIGFDIRAVDDIVIAPMSTALIHTGWQLADEPIVSGACIHGNLRTMLKIEGRSGLARKGIWPVGGIIDPNFRGEICPILFNSTQTEFNVETGDRIAQLVWYAVVTDWYEHGRTVDIVEVSDVTTSNRGEAGLGSSGIK
jgi:dUTP pyrophosphatase